MMDSVVRVMTQAMTHVLLNHLWQSTLFAVAAGLLCLALRRNGAHTRYWLWCAASYKFLIPFSMLTAAGSYLSWRSAPATPVPPMLDQFVQPFSMNAVIVPVVQMNPAPEAVLNPVWIWMAIWACGTFAVATYWMVRWLRIRAVVRNATPLSLSAMLMNPVIPVRLSRMLIEPGVVGLFRPVLLLPEGISERLTPQQLQTIVTHEMCHVRRRDNLTAAIHMLVEALFWFHPLVWWLGRRMIVEREAACDESVIASGGDREAYAEALLTVCKFYVESPLPSAAGVSGADLKKRIFRIMTERVARKLDFSRKLLLSVAGFVAIAVPIAFGLANATQTRTGSRYENAAVAMPAAIGPENPARSRGSNYIAALGTVTPVNTVSVTSRVQGQIRDVRYTEGQMVHKGDPLLDIDPRPYQAALAQMEGQLARDQAVLNEARINANTAQQMADQAQSVQQDEAMVETDEGKVQNARVNLEYCHITSPIAGRVGLRLVDPGNLVQANGTNPLVVVTQIQPITVIFNVAEDYLPQIERQLRQGQRLAVDVFDRTETKKFASGYLLAADNQIDAATGTVKLRAILPNADSSLFPNQFVNVRMEKGTESQTQARSSAAPPSCDVTIPNGSGSYGNSELWTTLPLGGVLQVAPDQQGKLSEKLVWDRTVHGHLSVSGHRLDGPGNFQTGPLEETIARRDTGLLVEGLVFPSEGCWQVTGSAGETELTFVVYVHSKPEAAEVVGTVRDTSGRVLPGATVTLINALTNTSQATQASGRGDYDFASLTAGLYTVKVDAKGFKPGIFKIGLAAWDRARVDAKMEASAAVQAAQAQSMPTVAAAPLPVFAVASIKPVKSGPGMIKMIFTSDGFTATGATLQMIIRLAYGLQDFQISGAPNWLKSERYDIEAKVDGALVDGLQKLSLDQHKLMLQALLAARFKLAVHRETKELPVYALVVVKAGKLHEDQNDCTPPNQPPPAPEPGKWPSVPCGTLFQFPGHLGGQKVSVTQLIAPLSLFIGQPVLDKTSLAGKYDINLDWTPDQDQFPAPPVGGPNGPSQFPQPDPNGPSLSTAIQEQLGLKLELTKGPVDTIVIDRVEKPSEN